MSTPHRFDRRRFLAGSAATAAAIAALGRGLDAGAAPSTPDPAQPVSTGRLLVVFLRGGMDGLSAVVPLLDGAAYRSARPTIAVPEQDALDLDGRFALHPGLAPLRELHQAGELAVVHAVGNGTDSRSHFSAQAEVELGGVVTGQGWLTRLLAATGSPVDAAVRAIALSGLTPLSLLACDASVSTPRLAGFGLGGSGGLLAGDRSAAALAALYADDGPTGGRALDAVAQLAPVTGAAAPTAVAAGGGPNGGATLAEQLADAAALFRADVGIEVVTVDAGGWDLHNDLGAAGQGPMRSLLDELGTALHGFWTAVQDHTGAPVSVVVLSEFGRRVTENGSGGVDHGSANALLVLGRGLKTGGSVVADWPGLAADQLDDGDLRATVDYRSVLAELSGPGRFGAADPAALFPGFTPTPIGLV